MTSNYEFLEMLHRELKPRGYLEIGVRHGDSLKLAKCKSVGIDPANVPWLQPHCEIFQETSDSFFARHGTGGPWFDMDLVYIDGMHLYEYALRDFINVAQWANERTVVVFDDTHPYNSAIATRAQLPGDWAGDVWKTMELIEKASNLELITAQVDVSPTGAFVVWGFDREFSQDFQVKEELSLFLDTPALTDNILVPPDILDRRNTITPDEVIAEIKKDIV